jgi:hypothetical protein
MQLLPGTVDTPGSEVVMDGLPGREVPRKQAPGAAALEDLEDIEDGIENLTGMVDLRATDSFGSRQVWLEVGSFSIGEVGRVCCSHTR